MERRKALRTPHELEVIEFKQITPLANNNSNTRLQYFRALLGLAWIDFHENRHQKLDMRLTELHILKKQMPKQPVFILVAEVLDGLRAWQKKQPDGKQKAGHNIELLAARASSPKPMIIYLQSQFAKQKGAP
ncbi:MAG: hypothetical protein JNN12_11325 [Bacteroidetes Order II. Incertae sedis bacterium]|nr:hypothetical protein [Bacteroidetes Order II. bacterium]